MGRKMAWPFRRGRSLRCHIGNVNQTITETLGWSEAWKWPVEENLSSRFGFTTSGNGYRIFFAEGEFCKGNSLFQWFTRTPR